VIGNKKYVNQEVCIKQHDMKDCGAACLATIAKQYGLKVPISKIREVAGTDKELRILSYNSQFLIFNFLLNFCL
jgi:ABC-type bacteriocin/lantibiotic exporter with double-glycine peptidase domain